MKKKLLSICATVLSFAVSAGSFAGCGTHEHTYSTDWTTDATNHWHAATCAHTEEKSDDGAHTFGSDNKCTVCGYEKVVAHEHTYATTWTTDATNHWHAANCGHTGEKSDEATHTFGANNKCTVCGYEKVVAHEHTYATTWTTDATNHWHAATCGHTTEISGNATHTFGSNNKCTVCGYEKTPAKPSNETIYEAEDSTHTTCVDAAGHNDGEEMGLQTVGDVTFITRFGVEGDTITFKFNVDTETDVKLKLYAGSVNINPQTFSCDEYDLSTNTLATFTLNGNSITLTGVLPATGLNEFTDWGTGEANVHLKAGENTFVITATGAGQWGGAINVDKVSIVSNETIYEAETVATYTDGENSTDAMTVQTSGDGATTFITRFGALGDTITFKFNADEECDAIINLYAGSVNINSSWGIDEYDLSTNTLATFTLNGNAITFNGVLPATGLNEFNEFGKGTVNVHLQAGENTLVITGMGANNGMNGINIDKIGIIVGGSAETPPDVPAGITLEGTQQVVVMGNSGGPVVTKTIIHLNKTVTTGSVNAASFSVRETYQTTNWAGITDKTVQPTPRTSSRTVSAAYTSDANGNKVETDSEYVTLELSGGNNLFFMDWSDHDLNKFSTNYALEISLKDKTLTTMEEDAVETLNIDAANLNTALKPQLEGFALDGVYTDTESNRTLHYASYAPEVTDSGKHPLVIWLHGVGEGGTDPTVTLLGNQVPTLIGEEFQNVMGGAYVLVPQSPDRWMYWGDEPGDVGQTPTGPSVYTVTLKGLIDKFISDNADIDADRIYIGGCSMGGYMTMNMVLQYSDFFAAAFPICEAYVDAGITGEQLQSIKDLPMWFVYCENDNTVAPNLHSAATIERLNALNANIHTSVFETGGHNGAWERFYGNECVEGETNMWQWLAQQSKVSDEIN